MNLQLDVRSDDVQHVVRAAGTEVEVVVALLELREILDRDGHGASAPVALSDRRVAVLAALARQRERTVVLVPRAAVEAIVEGVARAEAPGVEIDFRALRIGHVD